VRPGKGKYSQGKVGGQMSGGKPGSTGSRYMQRYRPEPELPVPYPRKRRGKVHGVNARVMVVGRNAMPGACRPHTQRRPKQTLVGGGTGPVIFEGGWYWCWWCVVKGLSMNE
jgi:hypothetical protein